MKQPEDTKTGDLFVSANARRQAAFRRRWVDAGWKRTTLWVHEADFAAGRKAARHGASVHVGSPIPEGVDPRSWLLGFCEGLEGRGRKASRARVAGGV